MASKKVIFVDDEVHERLKVEAGLKGYTINNAIRERLGLSVSPLVLGPREKKGKKK